MNWIKYRIELPGIKGSIKEVCKDLYVLGYTDKLEVAVHDQNAKLANILASKILEWYDNNIDHILQSKFVYDKANQILTRNLLKELKEDTNSI